MEICRKFERLVSFGAYTVFKMKFADRLTLSVLLRSGLTWLFDRMSDECAPLPVGPQIRGFQCHTAFCFYIKP